MQAICVCLESLGPMSVFFSFFDLGFFFLLLRSVQTLDGLEYM